MQFPGLYASDRYPPHILHLGSGGGSCYPGTMRTFALRRPCDQYYSAGDYDHLFYPTNLRHLSDDTGSFFPNSIKRYPTCRPAPRPAVETAVPFMFGTRLVTPPDHPHSAAGVPELQHHSVLDEALNMAKNLLGSLYDSQGKPVPREGETEKAQESSIVAGSGEQQSEEGTGSASEGESRALVSKRPQWTRSLSVPGFAPEEIEVKVKDNKVHVHALHEESRGSSPYTIKMEKVHTVKLPENIDQESLDCSLKSDGYLQLRAPLSSKLRLEHKEMPAALENKPPEKLQALEGRRKTEALEDKSEKKEALEDKAKRVEGVTFLTDKLLSDILNTKGDECSQVEIPVQQLVQTLLSEAARVPEVLSETLSVLTGKKNIEATTGKEPASEKDSEVKAESTEVKKSTDGEKPAPEEKTPQEAPEEPSEAPSDADATPPLKCNIEDQPTTATATEPASEKQELFCKTIPLAGFSPGNINVNLQGHTLTITAQRQAWFEDCAYTEGIERRVELPAHMDPSTVRCIYEDSGNMVITARLKDHQQQVPVEVATK
ncbi:uncharacterized protein [Littorina saxatilis]|uniref:SHSP domain-containing protein n=1 Tax=Littorina saxatilis TaxID=31220 RepID=A0AAN9BLD3_9CAEN